MVKMEGDGARAFEARVTRGGEANDDERKQVSTLEYERVLDAAAEYFAEENGRLRMRVCELEERIEELELLLDQCRGRAETSALSAQAPHEHSESHAPAGDHQPGKVAAVQNKIVSLLRQTGVYSFGRT